MEKSDKELSKLIAKKNDLLNRIEKYKKRTGSSMGGLGQRVMLKELNAEILANVDKPKVKSLDDVRAIYKRKVEMDE